ncbi:CU044_2847 family protein [Streptomyces silvisoli]|uniref:CU044_2847 family protein n=1 Tax=Streptomyces silvisoli TaxID=3034235 RepID=A0ABT5ZPW2_9ACTN|nr:CU044_2847 family protein [Streptomyces silvisoli]MDF3291870.1 CU044_2847 family protein [Streptomyces silvisoli]
MPSLVRIPLEGGGAILLEEVEDAPGFDGPVKAGRVGDAVRELPRTLQESLVSMREMTRAVLGELREAGSRQVEVEFGLNLSAKSGAFITAGEAAVHLKVRVVWESGEPGHDAS